jgi:plasmid stabilization system protein ParE
VTRIRWTTKAADQLEAIVRRIEKDNPDAARAVAETVFDCIAQLEAFPSLGRPGERKGTRELVCSPYVIVCRLHNEVAEILYIWHDAQDWK